MSIRTSLSITTDLTILDCSVCGSLFGLTADLEGRRRKDGANFYCPNGHSQRFTKSELERAQAETERLKRELHTTRATLTLVEQTRDEVITLNGKLSKQQRALRQRLKAGVCPCCHRTFQQLARHMAGKHPGFTP
jgi:HAMP domain-containing protein